MLRTLKKTLCTNILLKTASIVLGTTLWYIISQSHTTTLKLTVPVCFYPEKKSSTITAPQTIEVTLQGKRKDLRSLDRKNLGVHINTNQLHSGENPLRVTTASLFLPEHIKVVHYTPANNVIILDNNEAPIS